MIRTILLVIAIVLFILAGLDVLKPQRGSWGWFGLACLALAMLI